MEDLFKARCMRWEDCAEDKEGNRFIQVGFFRVAVGFQESRPGGNAPLPFMGRITDKGRFLPLCSLWPIGADQGQFPATDEVDRPSVQG